MRAKSAHEKGRRLENYLRDRFAREVDSNAHKVAGSGAGTEKGDILIPAHNIVVEAKNKQQINLIKDWEQAKAQAFNETPILAIRNPKEAEFKEVLIVLDLDTFIRLLNNSKDSKDTMDVEYTMDYQTRNAMNRLKLAINEVMRVSPVE